MTAHPQITVLLPTCNPDPARLQRTLDGLSRQTLAAANWETILIDNASCPPLEPGLIPAMLPRARVVREEKPGLSFARARGFKEAQADICVLVDDDNVLAPDYLEQTIEIFARHPELGAIGGRSLPEFEREPDGWEREFFPLLALRDLGESAQICESLAAPDGSRNVYPPCAPIGAGMALRLAAARSWSNRGPTAQLPDRQGSSLSSSGDNDIVLTVMKEGWSIGYFPELKLLHLIAARRLHPSHLARLNRGIQKSWIQVLAMHEACPWPPIGRWTLPLRKLKAWFAYRAWSGPAAYVRWCGACGHFEGRATFGVEF